ncbi:hypothetical protein ACUXAV_000649 [Cupriavidus metallidurans]|uniref:hypothetical protein n=1 Tax=Cupriavidus metallidurans TaxID=119219 RepID=UPI000493625F|nr:hypothetical protein [Cupriavidus metallidurans]MDE4918550.1 hypothetical protein [Cupriavidus metallidurans]
MSIGPFNTGRDVVLDVTLPTGPLRLPSTTTGWEAKPKYKQIESIAINGENNHANIPIGWTGTIELDRTDNVVSDAFATIEANYYAGINIGYATITETISESNGSVTQYRYTKVSLRLEENGKFVGDDRVQVKIGFDASRRIRL